MHFKKIGILFLFFALISCSTTSNSSTNENIVISSYNEGFFVFDLPSNYIFTSSRDFENILLDVSKSIQKKIYPVKETNIFYNVTINAIENSIYDIAFKRDLSLGKLSYSKDKGKNQLTIYIYKSFVSRVDEVYQAYKLYSKENRKYPKDKFRNINKLKEYQFNLDMFNKFKDRTAFVILANYHLQNIFRICNSSYIENKIDSKVSMLRSSISVELPIYRVDGSSISFDWNILYRYLDLNGNVVIKRDFAIVENKIVLPIAEHAGKNLLVFTPVVFKDLDNVDNEFLKKIIIDIKNVLQRKTVRVLNTVTIPQRNYNISIKIVDLDFAGNFNGFTTETNLSAGLKSKNLSNITLSSAAVTNIASLLLEAKKLGSRYLVIGTASVLDYSTVDASYSVDVKTAVDIYDVYNGKLLYKLNQVSNARGKNQTIILPLAYTGAGLKLVDSINETLP